MCIRDRLVTFPLGPPQELINGRPDDLKIHSFIGRKPNGAVKRQTVVRGKRMEYVGRQTNNGASGCKYLLGVLNRGTNKLKLVEPGPVLPLTSEFIGQSAKEAASHEQQKKDREGRQAMTANERFLAKQSLVEKFGSRTKQNELKTRRANIVSESNIANTSAVLAELQSKAKTTLKANDGSAPLDGIPPFNAAASEEHEAYPVLSCMPKHELENLKAEAAIFMGDDSDPEAAGYSPYICRVAKKTNTHPKLSEIQRAMCIALMSYMIQLKHTPRSFSEKRAMTLMDPCPAGTLMSLLKRFTEDSVNEFDQPVLARPPKVADKLLFHIATAALIVDGFEVEIAELAVDLKMGEKELEPYFKGLGCVSRKRKNPMTGNTATVAVLQVPIKFPAPSKRLRAR
eukprot:TRINITY_DN11545_c0_g2_i2.p1 TRINITY_DN11545_c0_g2~~TRINITY_DN11545_c0_g2_i2.p1  ORF type:complete len:399 (-),score=117.56 TRINITY_DN11545_c0_g2_i2:170-1366(-)